MKMIEKRIRTVSAGLLTVAALILGACGGGGGGGAPAAPPVTSPPPPAVSNYAVDLTADDVPGGSSANGTGTATIQHNATNGQVSISVNLDNIDADSVSLRRGFAGSRGDEVVALVQGATAAEWSADTQPFSAADAAELGAGALYIGVTTAADPDGAIRGQILPPGLTVHRFALNADQVADYSDSPASGTGWLTANDNASSLALHVVTENIADADAGTANNAIAGAVGPVLATLSKDIDDETHWFVDGITRTAGIDSAIAGGAFYVSLSSPAYPDGAIRGQVTPDGIEVVSADLTGGAVVGLKAYRKSAPPRGRLMVTVRSNNLSAVVNLFTVNNATGVELRKAPAGQNGPVDAMFAQDGGDPDRWSLIDHAIDPVLAAALDSRSLYVNVTTGGAPDGYARAQVHTASSMPPQDLDTLAVIAVDPNDASDLAALPETVFVTLNREPMASTVSPLSVVVDRSGEDGSFTDGNEVLITPASVTANGNTVEISLAAVASIDDVYRVTLAGDGSDSIADLNGLPMDGDENGHPGGNFQSTFEVITPPVEATLSKVQAEIFTPSCTNVGCHSGDNPPDGLLLTDGDTWSNTVNVASLQMPNLNRIQPGDPDNSYLVRKVEGTNIVANRMPLGAAALTQEQIDLIRQWVEEGALDN